MVCQQTLDGRLVERHNQLPLCVIPPENSEEVDSNKPGKYLAYLIGMLRFTDSYWYIRMYIYNVVALMKEVCIS